MTGSDDGEVRFRFPVLIGDIGGTNARFSIIGGETSGAGEPRIVKTADFAGVDEAIRAAVLDGAPRRPRTAILAVAAPIEGDEVRLTNCPWVIRPRRMLAEFGLDDVVLLNDFEAQALAVAALGMDHMEKIGGGEPVANAARVVLGPGTGLGVAGLVHAFGGWVPVPGEGGHIDLGPRTRRDHEVFANIETLDGRVSGEDILCGRGLTNLYRAIARAGGGEPALTAPSDITAAGLAGSDATAVETLEIFTTLLGRVAGDVALIFKARGGVYLSGGIAQKIVPALKAGNFRAAFEDKAPHNALMRSIPVHVVGHPLAALAGLAAYARTPSGFGVETAGRRWRT